MKQLTLLGIMGLLFAANGCMGTQSGQLYNMKTGQKSSFEVDASPQSHGAVKGQLPDGSACQGQFSNVSTDNAQKIASGSPMLTENSTASVAVLDCGAGRVLKCTLASRQWDQFSYGECQDQQGTPYSLIF